MNVPCRLSPGRAELLGLLVAAADPRVYGGCAVLRPLWANEAMHRAWTMARLALRLDACDGGSGGALGAQIECRVAEALACSYAALEIRHDPAVLPCSELLRELVSNLVELFGPIAGRVQLQTAIARVALPAFKRRALLLAASELVVNAITHAFHGRAGGEIIVTLESLGRGHARLAVADNGSGVAATAAAAGAGASILCDLANLLESTLVYRSAPGGGAWAQIAFPCSA